MAADFDSAVSQIEQALFAGDESARGDERDTIGVAKENGSRKRRRLLNDGSQKRRRHSSLIADDPIAEPQVTEAAEAITQFSIKIGLSSTELHKTALLITNPRLSETLRLQLIKALIPKDVVDHHTVIELLGAFNTPHYSPAVRALLLKWLILVHDYVDDWRPLRGLYQLFFRCVDNDFFRPHACHLLALITRREDVLPFRVRHLQKLLLAAASQDASLIGLFSKFRDLAPGLVPISAMLAKQRATGVFRCPDIVWQQIIENVRSLRAVDNASPNAAAAAATPAAAAVDTISRKRLRGDGTLSVSPAVPPAFRDLAVTNFHGIVSASDFAAQLPRLRLPPAGLGAAVVQGNRWVAHLLLLRPNRENTVRLGHWLASALESEFRGHSIHSRKAGGGFTEPLLAQTAALSPRAALLTALADFSDLAHENFPIAEAFVVQFLRTWNGAGLDMPLIDSTARLTDTAHSRTFSEDALVADAVLRLVEWLHPCPYEKLYAEVLKPLARVAVATSRTGQVRMLTAVTRLIGRWAALPWQQWLANGYPQAGDGPLGIGQRFCFAGAPPKVDHMRTIYELIKFAGNMAATLHASSGPHPLMEHAILSLYENAVSVLHMKYNLPFSVLPPVPLVQMLLASSQAATVSRLCGVVVNYRKEYERLKALASSLATSTTRSSGPVTTPQGFPLLTFSNGIDRVAEFNACVLLLCNALYRGRIFDASQPGPIKESFGIPNENVRQILQIYNQHQLRGAPTIGEALGITRSSAFASLAWEFLKNVEARQVTNGNVVCQPNLILSSEFKAHFLDMLRERRLEGLVEFLFTFIQSLAQARASR